MEPTTVNKTKTNGLYKRIHIAADSNGQAPARIELLRTGEWPASSNKGALRETVASLNEYARNYASGIGQSKDDNGNYLGVPINYMHEGWSKAAAWMKKMEVLPSSTPNLDPDMGGMALWATEVEWTPAGAKCVADGEFKCISPEWWPASRGDWTDPEDPNITARNVIDGAGLTNIPFFKGLQSITASNISGERGSEDKDVVYIKASERNKEINMQPTLESVRAKESVAVLNEDEKKLLADNKSELTADELKKFGLEEPANPGNKIEEPATPAQPVTASQVKGTEGNVVMAASEVVQLREKAAKSEDLEGRVKTLEGSVQASEKEKVESEVDKHIARGAIKADRKEFWVEKIMADESAKELLDNAPDNAVMAGAKGSDKGAKVAATATEEIEKLAVEKVKASKEAGKEIDKGAAYSEVMKENPELARQYQDETQGKE
jgi:hypothetical protein